jgi:hypothetical protein
MVWIRDPWIGLIVNSIAAITAVVALIRCAWSGEKPWIRWLGKIGLPIVLGAIILNYLVQYDSLQSHNEHRKVAYAKLSQGTSQFLSLIVEMITAASDGWLPANEGELFSRRSVDLICRHLNIDSQGPRGVSLGPEDSASELRRRFPEGMKWHERITYYTSRYRSILSKAIESYNCCITSNLYKTIHELNNRLSGSTLLRVPEQWSMFKEINPTFYPVLCANIEDHIEVIFNKLSIVVSEIRSGLNYYNLPNIMDNQITIKNSIDQDIGKSRFELTDVELSSTPINFRKVSFSGYTASTYIKGTEFTNQVVKQINPLQTLGPYCKHLIPAILGPNTYSSKYSFLTTADKYAIKNCNDRPLEVVFNTPVTRVKILFNGISDIYELRGYSQGGEIVASESQRNDNIEIVSGHSNIVRIEFGGRRGLTMVSALEFWE